MKFLSSIMALGWRAVVAALLVVIALQSAKLVVDALKVADLKTTISNERAARSAEDKNRALAFATKEKENRALEKDNAEKSSQLEAREQAHARTVAAVMLGTSRAADSLFKHLDGLDAAARDLGLPDAASCPVQFAQQRDAAVRARDVLRSCTAEYQFMAGEVDKLELKFETALAYIKIGQ